MSEGGARYVLGVDGGSTKTIALVADQSGRIVGAARGPSSSCTTVNIAGPMAIVMQIVREACEQARIDTAEISAGVFGLSGADWPEDHERREAYLARAGVARRVIVKNDAFVGLRAGTNARFGVVIAAGTSCNVAAVAPDGREWHFGYYQDYGGASTVGREAVRAVLHAEDGRGRRTRLTDVVLHRLGFASPELLLRALVAEQVPRSRIAELCPIVFEAAFEGDEAATEIVVRQGIGLAEYATALIRRFEMQRLAFDVVLAGSVFKGRGPLLIDTITQAIHRVAPSARLRRQRFEPAIGGVLLAYDALNTAVTAEMMATLAQTVPPPRFFDTTGGVEKDTPLSQKGDL
ncbi:MAG: hypothetical protein GX620_07825 [Chloroflexi bacterium]|nr:hypothetical protein [Chloroflexota bacterium]